MKKQVFNPYLPSYEYIPDGEPHVFGDRLYVFGSHDRFGGEKFCMNDYVCWSAPVDDLSDWRYEGVIYRKTQDPDNPEGIHVMYAPDVAQGPDGRFYLYYGLADDTKIGVAVCDTPAGAYRFYGMVRDKNGGVWGRREGDFMPFDPGILVEGPGEIHLYAGQGPMRAEEAEKNYREHFRNTAYHVRLEDDMLTMAEEPVELLPNLTNSAGTGFERHEFFEANSIRKFDGKYYFIYSSVQLHELVYAVSDHPDHGFVYGGTLHSNGNVRGSLEMTNPGMPSEQLEYYFGNNHGSLVQVGTHYYIFGHRHTNRSQFSRQGVAEEIFRNADGSFVQAEMTSCGLNGGPLRGIGSYPAGIACVLQTKGGAALSLGFLLGEEHPMITQSGSDREENPDQYIENLRDGARAGYRYFDFREENPKGIILQVRGEAEGVLTVYGGEPEQTFSEVKFSLSDKETWTELAAAITVPETVSALYFRYEGSGTVDLRSFTLA